MTEESKTTLWMLVLMFLCKLLALKLTSTRRKTLLRSLHKLFFLPGDNINVMTVMFIYKGGCALRKCLKNSSSLFTRCLMLAFQWDYLAWAPAEVKCRSFGTTCISISCLMWHDAAQFCILCHIFLMDLFSYLTGSLISLIRHYITVNIMSVPCFCLCNIKCWVMSCKHKLLCCIASWNDNILKMKAAGWRVMLAFLKPEPYCIHFRV